MVEREGERKDIYVNSFFRRGRWVRVKQTKQREPV
jgi:hypothetical protein